jgi:hypothetical protein
MNLHILRRTHKLIKSRKLCGFLVGFSYHLPTPHTAANFLSLVVVAKWQPIPFPAQKSGCVDTAFPIGHLFIIEVVLPLLYLRICVSKAG